jgi:hypothetical protein
MLYTAMYLFVAGALLLLGLGAYPILPVPGTDKD